MFRRDDKAEFRKHQQNNLGKYYWKQLLQFCNPTVVATGEYLGDENLRFFVTSHLSKDLEEQLKHAQKAITYMDRPEKKIVATMNRYYADKPDTTYLQVRLFMKKNEAAKLQQLVIVN